MYKRRFQKRRLADCLPCFEQKYAFISRRYHNKSANYRLQCKINYFCNCIDCRIIDCVCILFGRIWPDLVWFRGHHHLNCIFIAFKMKMIHRQTIRTSTKLSNSAASYNIIAGEYKFANKYSFSTVHCILRCNTRLW